MINLIKTILTIHFSCCFYFGLLAAYLHFPEMNPFVAFIKGFSIFPVNVIYLGCVLFSSIGVNFFLLRKK